MRNSTLLTALALVALASPVTAGEPPEAVNRAVADLVPGVAPAWIKAAPVPGLYEVVVGPNLFYVSEDGRYLMRGDVFEIASRSNVSSAARNLARSHAIDDLGESNMIVFAPETPQHTVTVFTDVDCGYCAKLHSEIDQYMDQGIAVRYIAFPRAGLESGSARKMVSVWCADDQRKAMTDAKAGRPVAEKMCPNPVAEQYQMGRLVGVRGTPTIVLETGDMVPGYVGAKQLREAIERAKAAGAASQG